ncbi:extracellular solute-binding protein [Halobacillus sp. A1]|uniref:ABC transporter substrate-binding protein n=1 Tax=Halobacillus sp. A1 TaxID=2880262 RepID=UPI0020A69842|nr:extracellular solute-binding protein [Halobacillus sp. A1]MCP3030257.1 extracellular solute-binding protein [Halobacillus sp. A1]
MRKISLAVIILLLMLVATACGNQSEGSKEEIEFLVSGDNVEGNAISTMAKKYSDENDVTIKVVEVPYADMSTRISNMVRDDNPPELVRTTSLSPLWKDSLMDLSEINKSLDIDENLPIKVDDETKALPLDLTAVGLFVNKDLFEEAGVSFPTNEEDTWTWDTFVDSVNEVVEKTNARYGFVMDGSEHRLQSMLYQFGSNGFVPNDEGGYTTNEETKEGLEYFVDINDNTTMPKSVWTSGEDATAMFKSGRVAAYMSGSWQLKDFSENIKDFEWKSVYMPYEETRATNLGGNFTLGFEGTGNEEETKKFIEWLYQKENYEELAKLGGYLPVVNDTDIQYDVAQESYELYQNEIKASPPVSAYMKTEMNGKQLTAEGNAQNVLKEQVISVLNGDQTIDEALEETTATYTEVYGEK